MALKKIKTIAHFEMKTLLRSWFFRIFAGLSILFLGIFNVAIFNESSGAPWLYRGISGNIPYINLFLLNLGQAIVAVFLASEFLKQDRKNDTIEVIYSRSMTNAQYIIGKSLGILYVFLILNIILLVMGIGFSFLANDSGKSIGEYFLYPLLISLPTLVFILGLSFMMMIIFKNQAITFIVLLGYIALTIFYLNNQYHHLFDYIAYKVPMMYSSIGGFGNFQEILLHRSIYFILGLGMIFITIFKLNRLPQSKKLTSLPLWIGILLIAFGGHLIHTYIELKEGNIDFKQELITINNKYAYDNVVTVEENKIELEHLGESMRVNSQMTISNTSGKGIDTLLFSLNPSLKVSQIKLNKEELSFIRELHILKIIPKQRIPNNTTHKLDIVYSGTIDERTHFMDVDLDKFELDFNLELFRVRKRFAYLTETFVCLTRESLWYPTAGITYASARPAYFAPDFTNFELKVKTTTGLTAISQGEMNLVDDQFSFKPEQALTQLSLLIGDYNKYSLKVDDIEYGIYAINGNEYFLEHFTDINDSLPGMIRDLKNEYETAIGLAYPFKRFYLAEVPVHFALDKHVYSITSDAVQPEIMFYPEKGVTLEETDFKKRKKRFEKRMKRDNEEVTPLDLQSRIFKRFVRGNYMANHRESYMYDEIMDRNSFSLFPNYYNFKTRLESKSWPMLDQALGVYLKERNSNAVSTYRWFSENLNKGERINLELKDASLKELLTNGYSFRDKSLDTEDQVYLNDIIQAKGDHLFSSFRARYGADQFNKAIDLFILTHPNRAFEFEELNQFFVDIFGTDITNEVDAWYDTRELPGFLIKDVETYKIKVGDYVKYQLRFKVSNPEPVDGLLTFNADLDNVEKKNEDNQTLPDFAQKLYIPAGKALEFGYVFNNDIKKINLFTHISENLPNNLIFNLDESDDLRRVDAFEGERPTELFTSLEESGAIVVDNEDPGFSFHQDLQKSFLKKLVDKTLKDSIKYKGLRFWNPPIEWHPFVRSGFYGKYVKSAYYTHSGEGERTASWKAEIKEAGYYDVYAHIEKVARRWGRRRALVGSYHFKIYHAEGVEEIRLLDKEVEKGWNYLGTFNLESKEALVEITNDVKGSMITADAIKWIKN